MGLPILYRKASPILQNYDWFDLATGTGYKKYYLCATTQDAASQGGSTIYYFLTQNESQDSTPPLDTEAGNNSVTKVLDKDFDISFNNPAVVKGKCLINFSLGNNGISLHTWFFIDVIHVDASSTETSIGSTWTPERTGVTSYFRESIQIDLTQKKIGVGEKLRINVQMWNGNQAGGTSTLYFDPSARASGLTDQQGYAMSTDFVAQIPFKISL